MTRWFMAAAAGALLAGAGLAQAAAPARSPAASAKDAAGNDIPGVYATPTAAFDYVKRVEMIPMRDGVKLYTVIWIPKGAHDAPIILTRTPYNAADAVRDSDAADGPTLLETLPLESEPFVKRGWIRVFQDVRGKYGSQGSYVMTRPPIGPLNPTRVDHVTDAYDTIDWLVKHTPESNGRVGMIGSSYEGFTVVMALLAPHPALKAAVPESPMVDGWMGDDWFHYGAFRNPAIDYVRTQTAQAGAGDDVPREAYDDYTTFLQAGSTGDYVRARALEKLPYLRRLMDHPAYDAFWRGQALDRLVAAHPSDVPTLWEQGLWDQEDMWGANHAYAALKAAGHEGNNWLVMGPWFHSQVNRIGDHLGEFKWSGDTAEQYRAEMVGPFFAHYLADGPDPKLAHATVYNAALNRWQQFPTWPTACAQGCAAALTPLYLQAAGAAGFDRPAASTVTRYVSDPAKPVSYTPRPVRFDDKESWRTWLIRDQRFIDGRPDVVTWETPPLKEAVTLQGAPQVDLAATTTGTDGDFVVKLIDVFPGQYGFRHTGEPGNQPELGGYEMPIGTDIFRGRYRNSFSDPSPIPANTPQRYRFALPNANHVFLPGHRIMVQVSSSAFPLYDRNPQTYVPNIFDAKPADYRAATIGVLEGGAQASAVWLPVVKGAGAATEGAGY